VLGLGVRTWRLHGKQNATPPVAISD